jgi:DNA polymerase III subunit gamma/tau
MTEALINKYRPKTWKEVIGQPEVVKSLRKILEGDTSHSFLFIGPSGCGKTTIARLIALELGATNPGDIVEVDAGQFTGIDDIRQLVSTLKYKPIGHSTVKALIVNEAHRLTIAAQDALLMSLEEPLDHVYWFLTTTEGFKIRAAIKTRCTTFELKPVSNNLLFDLISGIADIEHFAVSDPVLELCVKEANGSPRQAISNLAVCAEIEDRETAAKLLKSAHLEDREAIELCRALLKNATWEQILPILSGLQEQNAESIRQVIRAYMTKVILDTKSEKERLQALRVLDAFSQFFNNYDQLSPVVLAVGRLCYGET